MIKKIAFFTTVAIFIVIINNLVHEVIDLWQKQTVIEKAQHELSVKQTENKKLRQQLAQAQTTSFVEEEARDKLFLVKPGEEAVVLPQTIAQKKSNTLQQADPNWKQWVHLFFN